MRRVFVSLCAAVVLVLAGAVNVQASEPVTLAWDANTEPDLAGYIVEYGTASQQYTQSLSLGKVTQVTVTGLLADTTYYFVVRAYNNVGAVSSPSNEIVYRTQGAVSAATLSRVGATIAGFTPGTTVRGTDTAHDPVHDLFLVVFGEGPIYGAFVDTTGTPVTGAFTIMSGGASPGYFPRAEYSPHVTNGAGGQGGFLVTWHQTTGQLKHVSGRLVSYVAPGWLASGIQQISDNLQGSWHDSGPALAYSSTSRKFLVAWRTPQAGLRGRFVSTSGQPVGSSIEFEAAGGNYPSLAWNPRTDEFGLAFSGSNSASEFAALRRIGASNGAVSSRDAFGFAPKVFATAIDVNSVTNDYVLVWALGPGTMSATFDQLGTRLATNYVTDRLGFDNSLGIAFNEATGTFLVVSSDRDSKDVAAVELKGNGAPNSRPEVITAGATVGSFHPRAAARTGTIQWQVIYSFDLRANAVQVVSSSSLAGGSTTAPPSGTGAACATGDPFVVLGGGTCCNGGWLPPGMACSFTGATTPPPPPPTTPPTSVSGSTGAACAGGDPFAAMGGGTCCNGGWLPPGMVCSFAPVSTVTPPPLTTPLPTTAPPPSGGAGSGAACVGGDPFAAMGGGTCCNGGWLPPGMVCTFTLASIVPTPPSSTPPPSTTPPPSVGSGSGAACVGGDPFVAMGGGTCCNGGWLPPGMACSFTPASTVPPPPPGPTPPTPPGSGTACTGGDPFVILGGGTCCNGGWLPPGMVCRAR